MILLKIALQGLFFQRQLLFLRRLLLLFGCPCCGKVHEINTGNNLYQYRYQN